jgi:hypothetical protein
MKVTLNLPSGDARWRSAATLVPELNVISATSEPWIEVDSERRSVWIIERASTLPQNLGAAVPLDSVGLVVGALIPENERRPLEDAGLSWWDLRGSMHIALDNKLVHLERTPRKTKPSEEKQRKLGPVGTRAVQRMLITGQDRRWSVSGLAAEADVSIGQAHSVLTLMEQNELLKTVGQGSHKRRVLGSRDKCLDWLRDIEGGRRAPMGTWTYVYARNELERARKFGDIAAERGVNYAFTSSFAAKLLGAPVLTSSVLTYVRVQADSSEDARRALGLEYLDADEAGRGANIAIWADTGEVGTHDASLVEGLWVAPAVRVWLDLIRQGGRERDGADALREVLL